MGMRRPRSNKSPPVFSHEFLIQNHADIVSCVAMVFVIGLMFQATSPVASLFVALQNNVTVNSTEGQEPLTFYTCGIKDMFTVFFYFLICIVIHAVIQEYVLDKLNRKMHLSKVKHSKFNESGQLMAFYFGSAVWGADTFLRENLMNFTQLWEGYPHSNMPFMLKFYFIIQIAYWIHCFPNLLENIMDFDQTENLMNFTQLWEGYPHSNMPFMLKFYFIIQIAYWIHCFPELYFQKVKKDEIQGRIQYASLYLVFISAAYALNLTRVALVMLVLHYTVEFFYHLARLIYFADRQELAYHFFNIFNVLFVGFRLVTITLAVLTFWYGLQQSSQNTIDFAAGNYNTILVRFICLTSTCLLQAWMMWVFITSQLKRMREKNTLARSKTKSPLKKRRANDEDISALPEVDQNTAQNGTYRRKGKK